ncbi:MAG: ABC transporter ATP-binding protein [Chloroflexota bacterium]
MAAASPIVELKQASKAFGETLAVDRLSMAIAPGQVFGLIGPSGCGKTTTIRLLLGVLQPTSGTVCVMGSDPPHFSTELREQIGYTPQGFFLYPTLTVYENVRFVASLFGMGWRRRRTRIRQVLEFMELWDARRRLARQLSGGMQRRLELACALVHEPRLIFVDEPTAGLDPVLRTKIWDMLRTLRDQGVTIFVTTQYIDEIEHCDNVAILDHGRLLAIGTPEALRRKAIGGEVVEVQAADVSREAMTALRQLPEVKSIRWTDAGLRVVVEDAAVATPAITETLQERGQVVEAVRPVVASFDDVFKRIVGSEDGGNG